MEESFPLRVCTGGYSSLPSLITLPDHLGSKDLVRSTLIFAACLFFFADDDDFFPLSFRLPFVFVSVSIIADDDDETGEGKYFDVERRVRPRDALILPDLLVTLRNRKIEGLIMRPTIMTTREFGVVGTFWRIDSVGVVPPHLPSHDLPSRHE